MTTISGPKHNPEKGRDLAAEPKSTAYHEAGHAVVGVVEMDRLRRHLVSAVEYEVGELETEQLFTMGTERLRPDLDERLRTAKRKLSAVRRGRHLTAVTIRPSKRKKFLGCTYSPQRLSNDAIQFHGPDEAEIMCAKVTELLAGEMAELEFTGSASPHSAHHDNKAATELMVRVAGGGTWEAQGQFWAARKARARRLLRRSDVRRAVHSLARALLREERIPGKRAEELIRRALGRGGGR